MTDRTAILGLGAFGRLAASSIAATGREVVACDSSATEAPKGVRLVSIDEAAAAPVIVLAVPVQAFESALRDLAPRIPETDTRPLVLDVCSVKSEPCALMDATLPPHCDTLGTHPLFGPQTAAEKSIAGEPIALCAVRVSDERVQRVRAFCEDELQLRVHECSPQDHDEQMALVQALTHLIGHALGEMNIPELPALGTLAYRRVLQLKGNVQSDSEELFAAIQTHNPHAAAARARFADAVRAVMDRAEELS